MPKILATRKGVTPNGGDRYRWDRLNAGALAENWQLSMRSVVNFAWSQVYHPEHPIICLQHVYCDAGYHAGLSARADPCHEKVVAAFRNFDVLVIINRFW